MHVLAMAGDRHLELPPSLAALPLDVREKAPYLPTAWTVIATATNPLAYKEMSSTRAAPLSIRRGRFLSVDPVLGDPARPQTWNRYAYVHNNPVTLNDPDGRCEVICVAVILGIAGGLFLSGDVANAPAPGDQTIPNSPGNAIAGSAQGVAIAIPVNSVLNPSTITRYMGPGEAETARRTGNIPNTDAQGNPRPTHVTTDKPMNDAAAAQKKYELPTTPTNRATIPKSRADGLGPAPDGRPTTSGGGSQSATNQPIPVKPNEIKPLNQSWWDKVVSWFQ